jgi:holo-[acyl-carrier protein] synthase
VVDRRLGPARTGAVIVGLGIDTCGVARMRSIWQRHGDRFLSHWFAPAERDCVSGLRDPAERLAGRWAAKEAAAKALGTGFAQGVCPTQIAIVAAPAGAPALVLSGAAHERACLMGATRLHVSISHADGHAVAVVILEAG